MPVLALFRHAKAAAAVTGQQDFDRPLTERGRADAGRIGRVLAEFPIDTAIVSAAKRTCETWDIAAERFRPELRASIEAGLYLCQPSFLIERVRALPDTCAGAVLIGHNPCWHEVALRLAGGSHAGAMKHRFPTAALAVFTVGAPWATFDADVVRLERFVTPDTAA
jgi:phosphohistidine phosphatase